MNAIRSSRILLALLTTLVSAQGLAVRGLDLNGWCRAHHGEAFSARLSRGAPDGWVCTSAAGGDAFNIHVNKACAWEHGEGYFAMNWGWDSGRPDPMKWGCATDAHGVDLNRYCREAYGPAYAAALSGSGRDAFDWRCKTAFSNELYGINWNSACESQFGAGFYANYANPSDAGSWACIRD